MESEMQDGEPDMKKGQGNQTSTKKAKAWTSATGVE